MTRLYPMIGKEKTGNFAKFLAKSWLDNTIIRAIMGKRIALKIVKCPFCDQTYDITNFRAGDVLSCGGCSATLVVPKARGISSFSIQKAVSYVAGVPKKKLALAASAIAILVAISFIVLPKGAPAQKKDNNVVAAVIPSNPVKSEQAVKKEPEVASGSIERPLENISAITNKLYEEFGPKFYVSVSKPYLLAIEKSDTYLAQGKIEEYVKVLNALYKGFMDKFKDVLGLHEANDYLLVIILNSRESFDDYFLHSRGVPLSPEINGLYEYRNKRLIVYNEPNSHYHSLLHEGTHQLVHYFAKNTINVFWLQEGLSNYFESTHFDGIASNDKDINKDRLRDYKVALSEGKLARLEDIAKLSIDDFWKWFYGEERNIKSNSADAKVYYAESWALIYFLQNSKDGAFRQQFNSYFKKALDGEVGYGDFIKAFGDTDSLEKEFFDYMNELK